MYLRCVDCGARHPAEMLYACRTCGGILEVREPAGVSTAGDAYLQAGMWHYGQHLSVGDPAAIVSLREGMTPLHSADRLARRIGGLPARIWLKDETVNPTGSFKDRLISAAISRARELGCGGVVCASSGNAGASAAAYAARAGLPAVIVVPTKTPQEKLIQIGAYGALVVKVDGDYSHSYHLARRMSERHGLANLTTTYINPYGTDALKLVAYELRKQMGGECPDYVIVPTGAGPLVKGIVQGFSECGSGGKTKLIVVQAAGCAPIVRAFENDDDTVTAWETPSTVASGISDPLLGYERDGTYTLRLVRESGGLAAAVSDKEIVASMQALAVEEGILTEPTGAASVAALGMLLGRGRLRNANVVCMVTGHGFKDLGVYARMEPRVRHVRDEREVGAVISLAGTMKADC